MRRKSAATAPSASLPVSKMARLVDFQANINHGRKLKGKSQRDEHNKRTANARTLGPLTEHVMKAIFPNLTDKFSQKKIFAM